MESKTINQERQELVRKSNELIRNTRYELTETEQKIIIYLISKIDKNDEEMPNIKIRLKDYCLIAGIEYNGGAIKHLKNTIKALADKSWWLKINGQERLFRWVTDAVPKKEYMEIELHKSLKPYLIGLYRDFTEYSLINVLALRGKYSVRMYELFKSYAWHDKGNGYYWRVSLEDFKYKLNCTKYPSYKDFTKRVLKPSLEEINNYTDIEVSYTNIRFGREVKEIEFHIKKTLGVNDGALDVVLNQQERLGGYNEKI